MEKAIPDRPPGSRESPTTSSPQDQPGPSKERAPSVVQPSRSVSPSSTTRPAKRPPGLPPLREAPIGPSTLQVIRPRNEIVVLEQEAPVIPAPVQIVTPTEDVKTDQPMDVEEYDNSDMEDAPEPGKAPLVPEKWKEWISFKLEHFFTAVRLRADSDYGSQCPVPIDSGFKRYYCTEGNTSIRSIRELLQKKFCKEKNYLIHIIHPRFMQELDENVTLDVLAKETKWKRKRPLRILFTLIPPKEPPPSLEKEPMPTLEGSAKAQGSAVEEEDVQVLAAPVRMASGPPIMLTPVTTGHPQMQSNSTPEGLHPRQIPMPMTPQYAMINPQMMARAAPVKRKRENSETTPPQQQQQQQQQQIQMQRGPGGQIMMPFNPSQFTPQELQQLQMLHQRQQQVFMPQEMKNMRIAHMAQSFSGNRGTALYPVQVMSGGQMKAVPMQQGNGSPSPGQPPSQANAALLHKLLLQQQAQKHQKMKEEQMQRTVHHFQQMRAHQAQQVQLQRQALATAQRAMTKEGGPPPAKKMAIESPRTHRPESVPVSSPESVSQQHGDPKKTVFQVPSPPSPPKPQITAATPSPPAISPVPSKINKTDGEKPLKPYMAKVSVQPILSHQQTPPSVKSVNSPPPSLSPVISNDNLDFGSMAKMKNQSLGRTFKETLKKNVPPPIIDGIRAQVNGEGKVQISAAPERLELLRNSTIVPTLN